MSDHVDAGWYEWVTDNLGRDVARATAAARAASAVAAQGLGFNAAADAARASWEADRLAQVAATTAATNEPDPGRLPGYLIGATALACGGALASVALILWIIPPTATCTEYCPTFRNIAYLFLLGNVVMAGLHASLFLLMWRRRASWAWWASIVLVVAILGFDLVGELTTVAALANPNFVTPLETFGFLPALVVTEMLLLADHFFPGTVLVTLAYHWLLLHLAFVELPILILLSTRPVRRWCRIHMVIGRPS